MDNNVIETSIDELVQILKEKKKMSISEAADFLSVTHKELDPWLDVLEENGIIEINYPVIGEPKIVIKTTAPEKIDIKELKAKKEKVGIIEKIKEKVKLEKEEESKKKVKIGEEIPKGEFGIKEKIPEKPKEESEEEIPIKTKIRERVEIRPEVGGDEVEAVIERVEKLEDRIKEISHEVDVSMLKEELEEILLIIAGLRDVEKISFYLKEILSLIHKMKEKNIWSNEDKELVSTMLRTIADNWKEFGNHEIAEVFERIGKKVETA